MSPERIAELRSRSWLDHAGHNRMNADYDEMLDEIERLQGMYADACTEIEIHLAESERLRALGREILRSLEARCNGGGGGTSWEEVVQDYEARLTQ